ncbi:hypothetical protein ES703_50617 [subsurface metagenome]
MLYILVCNPHNLSGTGGTPKGPRLSKVTQANTPICDMARD